MMDPGRRIQKLEKNLVELGAADLFDVKHVLGERSADPFGDRIVDL